MFTFLGYHMGDPLHYGIISDCIFLSGLYIAYLIATKALGERK